MTLRARLTLVAAVAVAVVALLVAAIAFLVVRHELRGQVDESLERRARAVALAPPPLLNRPRLLPPGPLEDLGTFVQVVDAGGAVHRASSEEVTLPVGEATLEVAAGTRDAVFDDARAEGVHLRVLTVPLRGDFAIQLARPLTEVDETLQRVGFVLLAVALGGVVLAAVLGFGVARAALRPVERLTGTVEEVTETRDLSRRIEVSGHDELARLASSFNAMLEALEGSQRAQRQLVADASHELRTPLTSLRTNVEVLERAGEVSAAEREHLLDDVTLQLEELTTLVGDLVDLAREPEPELVLEDVRLDRLVEGALERARRRAPGVAFEAELEPSVVRGAPDRIDRAVTNLLDNAAKWSPEGGVVEVTVREGEVSVRDHGPGIDPADLPYVFDRFYRAASARSMPGSGLGLAIVRQVAESHGGKAVAEAAEGGGALLRLQLLPTS